MPFVNGFNVVNGAVQATTINPAPATYAGGKKYNALGEVYVSTAAPTGFVYNAPYRFAPDGALYISPGPIYVYQAGLPFTATGALCYSSGPGTGYNSGWPTTPQGIVIGGSVNPPPSTPIFIAPNQTTLAPTVAGNPTFTFTRTTLAYALDQDNVLRQSQINEARFQGARRVRNYLRNTENPSLWAILSACTVINSNSIAPDGSATAARISLNSIFAFFTPSYITGLLTSDVGTCSIWLKNFDSLHTTFRFTIDTNTDNGDYITITPEWRRYSITKAATGNQIFCAIQDRGTSPGPFGGSILVWHPQLELVNGQLNQAPSEYVSNDVLYVPYHGNAIDGVKYFATTNGNSVTANVVIEAPGTPIPDATMIGYYNEPAGTNILQQSQTFDTLWTINAGVIAPNVQTAPDGTLTADRYTDDAVNAFHRIIQNLAMTTLVYTYSVYVKQGTIPWIQLYAEGTPNWANFNLATGAVGNKQAATTATVQALPGGWYRCSITFTGTAASNNIQIFSSLIDSPTAVPSYLGTGTGTMFLWGAQLEQNAFVTTYIPTAAAAVSRGVDTLLYAKAGNFSDVAGTAYVEFTKAAIQIGAAGMVCGAPYEFTPLLTQETLSSRSFDGAVFLAGPTFSIPGNTLAKATVRWGAAARTLAANGVLGTPGTYDGNFDGTALGVGVNGSSGVANFSGALRNIKIYPAALTDAELIAMTT